jgi:hypothetical protein
LLPIYLHQVCGQHLIFHKNPEARELFPELVLAPIDSNGNLGQLYLKNYQIYPKNIMIWKQNHKILR